MSIRGDLLSADLTNVFQMLALNRKRGRLVVRDQGNVLAQRRVYIAEDRVCLDERPRPRPLAPLLVEMGVIDYDVWKDAEERGARYHADPVHLLRQQGRVSDQQLEEARRRVEEEDLLEVFLWKNVSFTLEEGGADPAGAAYFGVDQTIMEAARRQDEWRHIADAAGTHRKIFIRVGARVSTEDSGIEGISRIVLDHVDGVRGSREIREATGLPRYHVDLALCALESAGLVQPLGLGELLATGDALAGEDRLEEAIRLYRMAMVFERRQLVIHRRLAGALLKTGCIARAAAHYRFCAAMLLDSGGRQEAIGILANVLRILPTDFRSATRCLELLAEEPGAATPEVEEVIQHGRRLLAFHQEVGEDASALGIAQCLTRILPDDEDMATCAARLSLRRGKHSEAAAAYQRVAERRAAREEIGGAIDLYRTLVGVDPANRHNYEARIGDLTRWRDLRLKRRRIRRRLIAAAIACVALGAGAVMYVRLAEAALTAVPAAEITDAASARNAAAACRDFAAAWPLSPASWTAVSRARDFEARAAGLAEDEERQRLAAAEAVERREGVVRRRLAEAERLITSRVPDLDAALRIYQDAAEAARGLPAGSELRGEAGRRIEGVIVYLREGRELLRRADQALAADRPEEAFRLRQAVLSSHPALPECRDLELPVRIHACPPDAVVSVGSAAPGPSSAPPPTLPGRRGSMTLRAEAPGFAPAELEITTPPERFEICLWLESPGDAWADLGSAPGALVDLGGGCILGVRSDGRLKRLAAGGQAMAATQELRSLCSPPLVVADVLLMGTGFGEVISSDAVTLRERWIRSPFGGEAGLLPPRMAGGDAVIASPDGGIVRLRGSDGEELWRRPAAHRLLDVQVSGERLLALGEGGGLEVFALSDGRPLGTVAERWAAVAGDAGGGCVLVREDGKVFRLGAGLEPRDTGVNAAAGAPAPVLCGGVAAVFTSESALAMVDDAGVRTVPLPGPPEAVVGAGSACFLASFPDGRWALIDGRAGRALLVARGGPGSEAVRAADALYLADRQGRIRRFPAGP